MPLHHVTHESPSGIPANEHMNRRAVVAVESLRPMSYAAQETLGIAVNGQYPEANLARLVWASEHQAEQQLVQQSPYAAPNFTPMGSDGSSHIGAVAEAAALSVMREVDMLTNNAVRPEDANV